VAQDCAIDAIHARSVREQRRNRNTTQEHATGTVVACQS
jgi:hypothetical protein